MHCNSVCDRDGDVFVQAYSLTGADKRGRGWVGRLFEDLQRPVCLAQQRLEGRIADIGSRTLSVVL